MFRFYFLTRRVKVNILSIQRQRKKEKKKGKERVLQKIPICIFHQYFKQKSSRLYINCQGATLRISEMPPLRMQLTRPMNFTLKLQFYSITSLPLIPPFFSQQIDHPISNLLTSNMFSILPPVLCLKHKPNQVIPVFKSLQ